MKKIISTVFEVLALELFLIGVAYAYPERIRSIRSLAILCILFGLAIIISKVIECVIHIIICKKIVRSKHINCVISTLVCILISFGIFLASFSITEWIGMIPASTKTLLNMSILSAVVHAGISRMLDMLVDIKQIRFFEEMFKYDFEKNNCQDEEDKIN